MAPQRTWVRACIVTLVASFWLFFTVWFFIYPQITYLWGCSHTDCICWTFLHRVFSYASSKHVGHAQSHWLHLSAFSSMCVFKCALKSPACADTKLHWLQLFGFFQCVISNESSNCLPQQKQSYTGCICLVFPTVLFQMCTQMSCLIWRIVTLAAFVWLFSTVCS